MTSIFKKSPYIEWPCVLAIRESTVYKFVILNHCLPRLSAAHIESLKLVNHFRPEAPFQRQLALSKQEAVLFTASDPAAFESVSLVVGAGTAQSALLLLPFAAAAKELTHGDDKRILQMAVQYLAAGGVDDSLTAAEYDWDFIQKIKSDLPEH